MFYVFYIILTSDLVHKLKKQNKKKTFMREKERKKFLNAQFILIMRYKKVCTYEMFFKCSISVLLYIGMVNVTFAEKSLI